MYFFDGLAQRTRLSRRDVWRRRPAQDELSRRRINAGPSDDLSRLLPHPAGSVDELLAPQLHAFTRLRLAGQRLRWWWYELEVAIGEAHECTVGSHVDHGAGSPDRVGRREV